MMFRIGNHNDLYIDCLLDGILGTEFRYNIELEFDRGIGSEIWACEGEWREVECPQRKAVNIQWYIDPEDDDGVELPNEITILNDIEDEEAISDYISDVTGFCHKGFELEEYLWGYSAGMICSLWADINM